MSREQVNVERKKKMFFWPLNLLSGLTHMYGAMFEKSRIRETKHLSINADSSTDTIGQWTKKFQNQIFLKNRKIVKNAKTQKQKEI